jgi:hypothetical protein
MNITGMDYNTKREKLTMPEYGREVQNMVDYAINIPERDKRQKCAETIIKIMETMFPQMRESADYEQKLWDHLAIMSHFKLDIDYPYEVTSEEELTKRPHAMPYPMTKIRQRQYGHMIEELFDKLKNMPEGKERDELIRLTANQMKRNLTSYNHGTMDDEKIADDLARYTDGKVKLDLDTFKFSTMPVADLQKTKHNKRK